VQYLTDTTPVAQGLGPVVHVHGCTADAIKS
jgi:hypothetical protein